MVSENWCCAVRPGGLKPGHDIGSFSACPAPIMAHFTLRDRRYADPDGDRGLFARWCWAEDGAREGELAQARGDRRAISFTERRAVGGCERQADDRYWPPGAVRQIGPGPQRPGSPGVTSASACFVKLDETGVGRGWSRSRPAGDW